MEWVENYCEESGNSPCTGIADRAVELCLEKWDCHPGLLVPFENDVQAFFSGGIYAQDAMTVVAAWRRESSKHIGGVRRHTATTRGLLVDHAGMAQLNAEGPASMT